jgi:hypothetical protein
MEDRKKTAENLKKTAEDLKKTVKAKKSTSPSYVNAVTAKFNQFLTQQFLKTANVAIILKDNQITIMGLNEIQLSNLKIFSKSYFDSLGIYCSVLNAQISVKNGVYHTFNQLRYLADLAITKKTNPNKKKYTIKPFLGNNYGNYTKDIHHAVDILTDMSLIAPTTVNREKKYKLQLILYVLPAKKKST